MKEIIIDAYYQATEPSKAAPRYDVGIAADIFLKAIPLEVAALIPASQFVLLLSTIANLIHKGTPVVAVELAVIQSLAHDIPLLFPKTALGLNAKCKTLLHRVETPLKDNVVKFPRRTR